MDELLEIPPPAWLREVQQGRADIAADQQTIALRDVIKGLQDREARLLAEQPEANPILPRS